jgi:hypothetical protein
MGADADVGRAGRSVERLWGSRILLAAVARETVELGRKAIAEWAALTAQSAEQQDPGQKLSKAAHHRSSRIEKNAEWMVRSTISKV